MSDTLPLQRLLAVEQTLSTLTDRLGPLHAERDRLWQEMEPLKRRWEALGEQIAQAERDANAAALSKEKARLRTALGTEGNRQAARLQAESGAFGTRREV